MHRPVFSPKLATFHLNIRVVGDTSSTLFRPNLYSTQHLGTVTFMYNRSSKTLLIRKRFYQKTFYALKVFILRQAINLDVKSISCIKELF